MDEHTNQTTSESGERQPDRGDSDYEFTDEQREAVLQMQQMQGEQLEDDEWDPNASAFSDMDYSTFVSQRLKEVNEQWDKEPLPTNADRHTMIEFKKDQELTSVYAPQPYPAEDGQDKVDNFTSAEQTEEEEHSSASENNKQANPANGDDRQRLSVATGETNNVLPGEPLSHENREVLKPNKKKKSAKFVDLPNGSEKDDDVLHLDPTATSHSEANTNNSATVEKTEATERWAVRKRHDSDNSTHSSSSNHDHDKTPASDRKEEKMLVELNGKFELVSVKELQAMGYPLPEILNSETPESYTYHARTSRPASSVGVRSAPSTTQREKTRAQSATTTRQAHVRHDWDISHYVSPYALSPEQKEFKERREKIIKEREMTERERKAKEEKKRHDEAESAFRWWLDKKEGERQKQLVNKQNNEEDEEARKKENEKAFENWCEAKKDQQKKERLLKNREQKERDDAYFLRSRDECEQAFKKWLRNKKRVQQSIHSMSTHRYTSKRKHPRSKSAKANNRSIKAEWNSRLY